jgi:hypothetical protein
MVFNAVEDFVDFAELASQPISQSQTVAKAYTILNKTRSFKMAITEWNRKTDLEKTWIAFKAHFRQAPQELRETSDVTVEDSDIQRNNANLVQQVVEGLQTAFASGDAPAEEPTAQLEQMANSATHQHPGAPEPLAAQLAQMQQAMALLRVQVSNQGQQQSYNPAHQQHYNPSHQQPWHGHGSYGHPGQWNHGHGGRGGRGRGRSAGRFGNGGRGNNQFRQRNMSLYCWTHGGCGHIGTECNAKLPGHQDSATFQNKMGGNTANCPA